MQNATAGTDVTIVVPFMVDSEYATPDAGSVAYSVRDNLGNLITGLTNVQPTVAAGATQLAITVPAANNTITAPLQTEMRSLIVTYAVAEQPYQFTSAYRVNPWLNIAVTPADVRSRLGLSSTELADADVDFYSAYYLLDAQVQQMTSSLPAPVTMAQALSSGGLNAQYANNALVYKAAFDLLPSIPARLLHQEQQGQAKYERFSGYDFDSLHDQLADLLEDALVAITGVASTYPALLNVGNRPKLFRRGVSYVGGPYA